MEIDSAMLALGAEINPNGLLHVFGGGVDSLEATSLPGMLPPFWIIARIITDSVSGVESHHLSMSGINPKGEPFTLTQEGGVKFDFKPAEIPGGKSKANFLSQVNMIALNEGVYQFILSVDGNELKRLLLQIKVPKIDKG